MPKLRVHNFSVSLDGYGAGPNQGPDDPLGVDGMRLHEWIFATPTFAKASGGSGTAGADSGTAGADHAIGGAGLDDEMIAAAEIGIGATIMGRNMFGPVRGPWHRSEPTREWTGWRGDEPPFHQPVFVLTHHPRKSFTMAGGTTFHFLPPDATGAGLDKILERAFDAAGGRDVRLGGGVSTIQQFLRAGLVDEMRLAFVPVLLGRGERLFDNLGDGTIGYECVEMVASASAMHARFVKTVR